jgi:hypothetical protein
MEMENPRAGKPATEFSIYKLKDEYTKMVVIVNACETVDKSDFFHSVNGLRSRKPDGKVLRLA